MLSRVLDEIKLREEIQEASRFRKGGIFQMDVEVPGDNQLATEGGKDFHN